MPKHKTVHLTARATIGPYTKGQHVEEADEVEAILASEHRHHFIRVAADLEEKTALLSGAPNMSGQQLRPTDAPPVKAMAAAEPAVAETRK
jgi:hypothetical protein